MNCKNRKRVSQGFQRWETFLPEIRALVSLDSLTRRQDHRTASRYAVIHQVKAASLLFARGGFFSSNRVASGPDSATNAAVDTYRDPLNIEYVGFIFLSNRGDWRKNANVLQGLIFANSSVLLIFIAAGLFTACAQHELIRLGRDLNSREIWTLKVLGTVLSCLSVALLYRISWLRERLAIATAHLQGLAPHGADQTPAAPQRSPAFWATAVLYLLHVPPGLPPFAMASNQGWVYRGESLGALVSVVRLCHIAQQWAQMAHTASLPCSTIPAVAGVRDTGQLVLKRTLKDVRGSLAILLMWLLAAAGSFRLLIPSACRQPSSSGCTVEAPPSPTFLESLWLIATASLGARADASGGHGAGGGGGAVGRQCYG